MPSLTRAFFDFKGRENPHGYQSDTLLLQMALHPDDALHYDETHQKLKTQHPLSIATLKERIDFVEQGVVQHFKENNITEPDIKPLSNGGESLVFNCNNGYVLKMRTGGPYKNTGWNKALKASKIDHSENLDITYGIYPLVEDTKPSLLQRMSMCAKAALSGYLLADPNEYNFGLIQKAGKKILMVIDEGAVRPIQTAKDVFEVAKGLAKPVYQAMPFVHKPYRLFRDTVKEMLGVQKREVLPPLGVNAKNNF